MSEWPIVSLGDLCTLTVGHVGPMASKYVSEGVPFLRSQNVRAGRLDLENLRFIPDEFHQQLQNSQLFAGDIVIVRTGEPGAAALIPQGFDEVNCSDLVIARPSNRVDSRFLCYCINTTSRQYVDAHLVGAVQQHFNVSSARNLRLTVPSLRDQQAIAAVLGALDEKIAVNYQIVTASDEAIRLRYSQRAFATVNKIRIDSLGVLIRESLTVESLTGDENYIALDDMPRRCIWLAEWQKSAGVASAKMQFRRGDVLFGKLRPYFHKVGISFVDGVSSTDILVIRPRQDEFRGWLLAAISSDEVVAHASAVGDGTRMPRVKWGDLANYEVPWLGRERTARFGEFVSSITDRVSSACSENRGLAELRSTLLPRLMSGEIRVRDAEKLVEDAT